MLPQKDEKGRFLPGNKYHKKSTVNYITKKAQLKSEMVRCAHSLGLPMGNIDQDLKNPELSKLELLTLKAVKTGNYKFIQWLIEMTIGRPTPLLDPNIIEGETGSLAKLNDLDLQNKLQIILAK